MLGPKNIYQFTLTTEIVIVCCCSKIMHYLQLVSLLLFIFLQFALSSSQDGVPLQQVPVCAPLPGSSSQGAFQGSKGSQGVPGKKGVTGDKGERGFPGYPWGRGGCPIVTHHFPRSRQITNYVQYRDFVPSMKEATICVWIETTDYNDKAILGYASPETNANDLTVFALNPTRVRFIVRDELHDFNVPALPFMTKFHLCLTFSSKLNQRSIYINGDEVEFVSHSTSSSARGGKLVLGQDHDDKHGGGFDPNQSFWGNMTNFMIWPRVLIRHEVSNIARNCDCPSDFAIAMTLDRVEHFGETYYSIPDVCPTV